MDQNYEKMRVGYCRECGGRRAVENSSEGRFGCVAWVLAPFTCGLSLLLFLLPKRWCCTICGSEEIKSVE